MFNKSERGTLKYMWARWHAFNMCALNLKCWRFSYIFYNIDEILCKCVGLDIHKWHKSHRRHHIEYLGKHSPDKINWDMIFIGWECSKLINDIKPNNSGMQLMLTTVAYPEYTDLIMQKYDEFVNKYNIEY